MRGRLANVQDSLAFQMAALDLVRHHRSPRRPRSPLPRPGRRDAPAASEPSGPSPAAASGPADRATAARREVGRRSTDRTDLGMDFRGDGRMIGSLTPVAEPQVCLPVGNDRRSGRRRNGSAPSPRTAAASKSASASSAAKSTWGRSRLRTVEQLCRSNIRNGTSSRGPRAPPARRQWATETPPLANTWSRATSRPCHGWNS